MRLVVSLNVVLRRDATVVARVVQKVARNGNNRGVEGNVLDLNEKPLAFRSKECQIVLDIRKVIYALPVLQFPPGVLDLSPLERLGLQERRFADPLAVAVEKDV